MDNNEIIEERIAALEQSVDYYSGKNNAARERWVVHSFLENMNIGHAEDDVTSPEHDPPDVVALGAAFEVKEILDSGRRRHKEFKDELERVKRISNPSDLFKHSMPKDSSIEKFYTMCLGEAKALNEQYPPKTRSTIDLLFYVNLRNICEVASEPYPNVFDLQCCGWRSVSFVKGQIACCFYAMDGAPVWLRDAVGVIQRKAWE